MYDRSYSTQASFDIFGENISLDAMKNTSYFPWFAVVLLWDDHTIDIGLEALVRAENVQAYQFVVSSLIEMANEKSREEFLVVTSDDFLSQDIVACSVSIIVT